MRRGRITDLGHKSLEDHGTSLFAMRTWLDREHSAGRPASKADFFRLHGVCPDCEGRGVQFIEWEVPTTAEGIAEARAQGKRFLPAFEVCDACEGDGRLSAGPPGEPRATGA